jgi:MtrB/PioB family decaheme-associated outer membrane protein
VIAMEKRSQVLSVAVATILLAASVAARAEDAPAAAAAPAAAPAAPDTSTWKCSKCPFPTGYTSEAQLGAGYVDDSSAKFGDYTGLDEDGAYADVSAEGGARLESGYEFKYKLDDLGLDSRSVEIEAGKQGHYEVGLFYDRVPHRISDTGATIFNGVEGDDLGLPTGWVRAGTTGGMTALDASLRQVDVGYDRDRYGLAGRYFLGKNWSFGLDYKRDERSGSRPKYGSFGSVSTELLRPLDDATDRVNATVRYEGSHWFAQAGYYLSLYDTKTAAFRWENPFAPFGSFGGDVGQMALEPDNQYNEFSASVGWYGLPGNTAVTLSAAMGQGSQDTGFVPYTINPVPAVDPLPFSNLDGDVSVTRADVTVSSRPLDRLRLRGALAYDERDNDSRQGAFTSIVHTDLFPVGEDRVNRVYGYERTRLYGSADYDVYEDLSVGLGGEYRTTDRTGTKQEVMSEDYTDAFGRAQFRPSDYLGFVVKGGVVERDPEKYDTDLATQEYGQNPQMRKYQLAYLYRGYGELLANVAVGSLPLTLSGSVYYGDDSYMQSPLGLDSGLDRRYGVDLNWAVNEKISAYVSATREKIDSRMKSSSTFSDPDWKGRVQDDFETYGAGMSAQFAEKWRVNFDYTYGAGDTHTTIKGVSGGTFPPVKSELSSLKTDVTYAFNERTDFVFTWWYETLETRDWQFVPEPDAMPTVLALGVDPYNYDVNALTLSMRYRFGGPKGEEEEAAAAE